jgi:hypothetical protein
VLLFADAFRNRPAAPAMLRALVYGLAILHLGPGIAFALLAFGCEGPNPHLAALCGKDALPSFALLTAAVWLVLGLGLAALLLVRRARRSRLPNTGLRVWALLALLAAGALVGASVDWLAGSGMGYLAIPVALAAGWLSLANPPACQPAPPEPQPREARRP